MRKCRPFNDDSVAFTDNRSFTPEQLGVLAATADSGNPETQYLLGLTYYQVQSVEQDFAEAARWFMRPAESGVASAQLLLGHLYRVGQGVAGDDFEAAKWFRKAAVSLAHRTILD